MKILILTETDRDQMDALAFAELMFAMDFLVVIDDLNYSKFEVMKDRFGIHMEMWNAIKYVLGLLASIKSARHEWYEKNILVGKKGGEDGSG